MRLIFDVASFRVSATVIQAVATGLPGFTLASHLHSSHDQPAEPKEGDLRLRR